VTGSQSVFDYAQGTDVTILPILTTDDIDNLEGVIESCSGMNSSDAAINKILIEEMPAYFLDQKDLDAVIEIIQDRAQKVLDERG
jgi:Mg/Co/Ni transporter MgtE